MNEHGRVSGTFIFWGWKLRGSNFDGKNRKIVMDDTVRVNGGSNYEDQRKANHNNFQYEPYSPHFPVRATSKYSSFQKYFYFVTNPSSGEYFLKIWPRFLVGLKFFNDLKCWNVGIFKSMRMMSNFIQVKTEISSASKMANFHNSIIISKD